MASGPKVFISFSSKDSALVVELTKALKQHDVNVWEYDRPGDRIPPGSEIIATCQQKIRESDYVLAVVSESSCHPEFGQYPRLEVEYALHHKVGIVPIYDEASRPPTPLVAPYAELSGLLRLEVDSRQRETIRAEIKTLCTETFKIPIKSAIPYDVRLRLVERLRDEVANLKIARSVEVSLDKNARQFCERASKRNLENKDWKFCFRQIEAIIDDAEGARCQQRLYFPYVMKALCELELGRLKDLEDQLCDIPVEEPKGDHHVRALYGWLAFERGDYKEAVRINKEIPNAWWELAFNAAVAALAAGQLGSVKEALEPIPIDELTCDDRCRVWTAMGIEHLRRDELREAAGMFQRVLEDGSGAERNELINAATGSIDALIGLGDSDLGIERALYWADKLGEPELRYRAARYLRELGEYDAALEHFTRLESVDGPHRMRYLLGKSLTLDLMYRRSESHVCCRKIFEIEGTASSAEDFYNLGFAYFLTGEREKAAFYLELARKKAPEMTFAEYAEVHPGPRTTWAGMF